MVAKRAQPGSCAPGQSFTGRRRGHGASPRSPGNPRPLRIPPPPPPPLTRVPQLLVAVDGEDDQEVAQQVHHDGKDEDGGQGVGHPGRAARGVLGRRVPREDGTVQIAPVHSHPAGGQSRGGGGGGGGVPTALHRGAARPRAERGWRERALLPWPPPLRLRSFPEVCMCRGGTLL